MKQIQTVIALAILLFAGMNCGSTTNPVNEADSVETATTEVAVQPNPTAETPELEVEAAAEPALEPPQPPEEVVEEVVEKLAPGEGLSLGSQAPAFELPDGDNKLHALNDYIGDTKLVLVFYRGGW